MSDIRSVTPEADGAVLHPPLRVLRLAHAAASAAQLRLGPDASSATDAAVGDVESVPNGLLARLDPARVADRPPTTRRRTSH